jgi:hypothetical protein
MFSRVDRNRTKITSATRRTNTHVILLFTQGKEMPSKTRKQSRRQRRRTLKRKSKKGGSFTMKTVPDTQSLIPATDAFKVSVPTPSNKIV